MVEAIEDIPAEAGWSGYQGTPKNLARLVDNLASSSMSRQSIVDAVQNRIDEQPGLVLELLEDIGVLDDVIREYVYRRCERRQEFGGDNASRDIKGRSVSPNLDGSHSTTKRTGKNVASVTSQVFRKCILDELKVNGLPLREVTAEEALQNAEKRRINARIIETLCRDLKPDLTVGEQLSDTEATERAESVTKG